jgi:hypothetical protein
VHFFIKLVFGANGFISYYKPHNQHYNTTALLCFSKKPYTLAGFEPGSSFPQADAMATAPRRHLDVLTTLDRSYTRFLALKNFHF